MRTRFGFLSWPIDYWAAGEPNPVGSANGNAGDCDSLSPCPAADSVGCEAVGLTGIGRTGFASGVGDTLGAGGVSELIAGVLIAGALLAG